MLNDERAIRDVISAWLDASQAGDTDAVLKLMADDVLFMVPGQEPFGKAAFAKSATEMKGLRMKAKSDIQEVVVAGDWAWCRTHLEVEMTAPDGAAARRAGYTLSILRKQPDGRWLFARDANLLASH